MEKNNRTGREFNVQVDGKEVALHFRRPTQRELFDIDLAYRVAMTRLLKANVMTVHAATKLFEGSGDWTKLDEQSIKNLAILVAQISRRLEEEKDKNDKGDNLKLVDKITENRAKLHELVGRKMELFNNCAEMLAGQQRMHTLIILCCLGNDGERFFGGEDEYQDFVKDEPDATSTILAEAYNFDYGVEAEKFGEDWAEVKYLRELSEKEKAESAKAEQAAGAVVVEAGGGVPQAA